MLNIGEVKRKGAARTAERDRRLELGPQGARRSCPSRPSRTPVLRGETREKVTGCGSLYVTVNEDDFGPREVFANMGKAGGCASASTEAIGRLISLAFRYGVPPDKIVKQLKGIRCHVPLGFGPNQILSCPDAIGKALADKYHLAAGQRAPRPWASWRCPSPSPREPARLRRSHRARGRLHGVPVLRVLQVLVATGGRFAADRRDQATAG